MGIDISARLIEVCQAGHPEMVSLYLFGSQATGHPHRESDVDIGVLLDWVACPRPRERFDARLRLTGEIGRALGRNDVDLVVLNDAPPQLAREIVTRGVRLVCRDLAVDHGFLRTTLSRAADLEPFLRRTRQVTLAAIRR